jgi:DNA invertase Pin-like site-specific DNA recombinase
MHGLIYHPPGIEFLAANSPLRARRSNEGRERAKERGVKMGPKFKLTNHQIREVIRRRDREGEPVREIARTFNVSHSTISRLRA